MQTEHANFSTKNADEVVNFFVSSEQGLSSDQAEKRLSEYGRNELPDIERESLFFIFFRQFRSSLIFVLLAAAVTVLVMGDYADALIIFFVLFFNATLGAVQEGRAQNTFFALKKFVKGRAFVLRDRQETLLSDTEIVPGDVIILREGEKVPADARVIAESSLRVNESAFTGESLPKHKRVDTINQSNVPISDRYNMVFKGTTVVSGTGRAIVVATGSETVFGGIARETLGIDTDFPLKKDIQGLSKFVILFVIGVSLSIFFLGALGGSDMREVFKTLVAVSVSIIPEGLPIVLTLVLAHGVWRMGKKNVLVRKLQAVEVLGEMNVLAVDKTGTITKNELFVETVFCGGKQFSVEGNGYEPTGNVMIDGNRAYFSEYLELAEAGKAAAIGSNSAIIRDANTGAWSVAGDPTEGALLVFSEKAGVNREELFHCMPKIDELPFDYERKFHAVLVRGEHNNFVVITGSPEKILELSRERFSANGKSTLSSDDRNGFLGQFEELSAKGLRVIGFAFTETSKESLDPDRLPELVFGGFFGIRDSIREEVSRSVDRVEEAGVRVVMITGDAFSSARAIAEKAGIYRSGDGILQGEDVDRMSDEELACAVSSVRVFARVTPAHKLKIVQAYRSNGSIVAMTGDGVNDVLSLSAADIGISMGNIGTEVAKESSDIVLLDDNFVSIVHGVEEGRTIFFTIRRVVLYLFSTSLAEVLVIVGALLVGSPLPIVAAQILWLNLVTDGFLDVALAMEHHPLEKKNRFVKTSLVDRSMVWRMIGMAIPMAIGTLFLFYQYLEDDLTKAWTVSLVTLAAFQWFNAWNCRSRNRSVFSLGIFSNPFLVGATILVVGLQILALSNGFLQSILKTVPLSLEEWGLILAVASSVFVLEEMRKLFVRIRPSFVRMVQRKYT